MLNPDSQSTELDSPPVKVALAGPESMTEGYGDEPSRRPATGDVDFFSTLGTERKRGKPTEPQQVSVSLHPKIRNH
jgi:hypothetical protein